MPTPKSIPLHKYLTAILLTMFCTQAQAGESAIQFKQGTWDEIQQMAKAESKMIFVDAYATWCGPCKWMAKTVFTNDTVADFYNANFINTQMDMEKGEALELAKLWAIKAYPTLLFFSPEGELLHQTCGALPVAPFVELGKTALQPSQQIATKLKAYYNGKTDPDFTVELINLLFKSCMPYDTICKQYFLRGCFEII